MGNKISDTMYTLFCPYCWQTQELLEDIPQLDYTEIVQDCTICCNPIIFEIRKVNDEFEINIKKENE